MTTVEPSIFQTKCGCFLDLNEHLFHNMSHIESNNNSFNEQVFGPDTIMSAIWWLALKTFEQPDISGHLC